MGRRDFMKTAGAATAAVSAVPDTRIGAPGRAATERRLGTVDLPGYLDILRAREPSPRKAVQKALERVIGGLCP